MQKRVLNMFIHIGEKQIISDKTCVGIFNYDTLNQSAINNWIISDLNNKIKTVVIDKRNHIAHSKVSSYTVIKRDSIEKECIWRRANV